MLRVKIQQNLPSKTIISSSLPAQGLKNWHFKTLKFCFALNLRTIASVAQHKILHSCEKILKSRDWWDSSLLPCRTTFIFVIPSQFCKVTDRHRLSGKKNIQCSWNCVGLTLQHRRQQLYMPAQQEKKSIAFNRQAFGATSIICSDVFPCLYYVSQKLTFWFYTLYCLSLTQCLSVFSPF